MLISTLNCEMWPNFSYRGVRSVQLLLLLLLLMVFSSENFGFSPPYAGIAGIGPDFTFPLVEQLLIHLLVVPLICILNLKGLQMLMFVPFLYVCASLQCQLFHSPGQLICKTKGKFQQKVSTCFTLRFSNDRH